MIFCTFGHSCTCIGFQLYFNLANVFQFGRMQYNERGKFSQINKAAQAISNSLKHWTEAQLLCVLFQWVYSIIIIIQCWRDSICYSKTTHTPTKIASFSIEKNPFAISWFVIVPHRVIDVPVYSSVFQLNQNLSLNISRYDRWKKIQLTW